MIQPQGVSLVEAVGSTGCSSPGCSVSTGVVSGSKVVTLGAGSVSGGVVSTGVVSIGVVSISAVVTSPASVAVKGDCGVWPVAAASALPLPTSSQSQADTRHGSEREQRNEGGQPLHRRHDNRDDEMYP